MATPLKNVVLIGATGTVGSHILAALLSSPDEFKITILSRPTTKSSVKAHPAITEVKTSFDSAELVGIFRGQDAVIHAAGIPSLGDQFGIIDAAVSAGVKRFIINEYANSPHRTNLLPEMEQFRKTKKAVMAYVEAKTEAHPGFSWSGLATGNFIDLSLKKYPIFGMDIRNQKARLVDDGTERLTAVTMADIGVAVRGILRHPAETKNRICHIRSVESCQVEILEALKKEMGEEGWTVTSEKGEDMLERGRAGFAKGDRSGHLDLLVAQLFAAGGARSIVVTKEESDNKLLGVVEKDIGTVVRDVLATLEDVYPDCIIKG